MRQDAACQINVQSAHSAGAGVPQQQPRIVIVEDHDGMRQAIERLLRAAGYSIAAFGSAEALLQTSAADDAACLILDLRLPGLSGVDLRNRLANAGSTVPVIFLTAHDEAFTRLMASTTGAVACLQKPFVRRDLLDILARVVPAGSNHIP